MGAQSENSLLQTALDTDPQNLEESPERLQRSVCREKIVLSDGGKNAVALSGQRENKAQQKRN